MSTPKKPNIPLGLALQIQLPESATDITGDQMAEIMGQPFPRNDMDRVLYIAELRARLRFIEAEAMLKVAAEYQTETEPAPDIEALRLDARLAALAGTATIPGAKPSFVVHEAIRIADVFVHQISGGSDEKG